MAEKTRGGTVFVRKRSGKDLKAKTLDEFVALGKAEAEK